jgi:hypothetical protein
MTLVTEQVVGIQNPLVATILEERKKFALNDKKTKIKK